MIQLFINALDLQPVCIVEDKGVLIFTKQKEQFSKTVSTTKAICFSGCVCLICAET